ncbi:MAG: hypothetical protein KAU14_03430 [Thermoplasmata archaeon]|nr:hypothetical protein [Thermoplasmata archaeon]
MDFVPLGMEEPVVREPTRKDLEPLREVEVRPVEYLKGKEERSLFLSIRRYRPRKLPFSNTNIFVLQITAMIALFITITVNFYINPPENSILGEVSGFEDFLVWGTPLGASLLAIFCGTAIGGLAAYIKDMNLQKKTKLSMYLIQIIAASIGVITFFFIIVPLFDIKYLNFNNLELFAEYVMVPSVYFFFLLVFSSAVIFGVFGLLTGQTGPISLSTALIFLQIFLSFDSFAIESNDLVELFREESRITLFSIAYLAYVELSFAVSRFARDWRRTSRYDHRTGETTFTSLLGKTINLYIVFFIGIIIATYLMAMFSTHLDDLFSYFISPAMRDSIEHSTIYGKLMFVLLFFGLIALLKGIVPAKEYIKGKMNVTAEEIEVPMTIVEDRG